MKRRDYIEDYLQDIEIETGDVDTFISPKGFPIEPVKVNVAAGVIIRKNLEHDVYELLLIQRSPEDIWPLRYEIPRGKCGDKERGENIIDCLKREVKEETGLDVEPIKFIDKFEYIADMGKRISIQYNFLCRMIDPEQPIEISKEHVSFKWVRTMAEIQLFSTARELVTTISKVFDQNGEIVNYPAKQLAIEEQIDRFLKKIYKE